MEKGSFNGMMDHRMKGNISLGKNMERVNLDLLVETIMRGFG